MTETPTAQLLRDVASALNACERAGLPVRLRHGIVWTRAGYVLPLKDDRWGARDLNYDHFTGGPASWGKDDDDD
jgi:hypothetical protein